MDTLKGGGRLNAGDQLTSPDGDLELKMQSDGNFVLYWTPGNNKSGPPRVPCADR